ncbi:hypothetical protein VTN49DRAFT_5346 [Thermomyces lanuginosus]|uniref:uncharacterized protein n=1 Tax=Thermomyces lanuginosus TaxID=5541 RepID=UPI0037441202
MIHLIPHFTLHEASAVLHRVKCGPGRCTILFSAHAMPLLNEKETLTQNTPDRNHSITRRHTQTHTQTHADAMYVAHENLPFLNLT